MGSLTTEDKLAIQELLARSAWAYDESRMDVHGGLLLPGREDEPAHRGR